MHVFLYGTLLDTVLRHRLIGRHVAGVPAILNDHAVMEQRDAPLPALVMRAGTNVRGLLLKNLLAADIARLDAYEVPFDYKPSHRDVHVDDGVVTAAIYFPGPSVQVSDTLWSLSAWDAQSGALTREMALEIGAYDPPLQGDALRAQWHMIALRAGCRLRAQTDRTPSALRYVPDADGVEIMARKPLTGGFFKFAGFDIKHRTFQDETAGPLEREIMLGCDAAIVLPYDPVTDRVLLVEQIRMGPLIRSAPNPWTLEPVAGMIDGHETPEQAALRETHEEAGLEGITLEKMFAFYASPGGTTDYFYCFAAYGALPDPTTYTGGLAAENEDLRIHVLPFDDAMQLIETGEANVGPLIAMLLWIARNRDRLRTAP